MFKHLNVKLKVGKRNDRWRDLAVTLKVVSQDEMFFYYHYLLWERNITSR